MIIGFEAFVDKVIKETGEKCKYVVYGTYSDHIILMMILAGFYTQFTMTMLFSSYALFFLITYILVMIFVLVMIATRKIGFGMSDSRFVYIKFKHFSYKGREAYDIMFENIKYLDVRKFLGMTFVKMSFIDGTGRFRRLKFRYAPIVMGLSVDKQKTNGLYIAKKLEEIQKVLDRGDF